MPSHPTPYWNLYSPGPFDSIFLDLPLIFDPKAMVKEGGLPFKFRKERGARLGVLPRHATSDTVRWFTASGCFVFHVVNAWEEAATTGSQPVVVVVASRWGHSLAFLPRPHCWSFRLL